MFGGTGGRYKALLSGRRQKSCSAPKPTHPGDEGEDGDGATPRRQRGETTVCLPRSPQKQGPSREGWVKAAQGEGCSPSRCHGSTPQQKHLLYSLKQLSAATHECCTQQNPPSNPFSPTPAHTGLKLNPLGTWKEGGGHTWGSVPALACVSPPAGAATFPQLSHALKNNNHQRGKKKQPQKTTKQPTSEPNKTVRKNSGG